MAAEPTTSRIPIRDLVRYYLRLGVLGFGGPVALVGQMERELVGEKKWLTKEEMREGIAVCQSLPGPLAIQVGIWISYIRGGFWGAWAGGWAFILPNFIIVTALGALYVRFEGLPAVAAIFYGVSPAVIALILHSCYRLSAPCRFWRFRGEFRRTARQASRVLSESWLSHFWQRPRDRSLSGEGPRAANRLVERA